VARRETEHIASIAQGCGHLVDDVVEVLAEVDRGKNVR
jgi:hypothetical protein